MFTLIKKLYVKIKRKNAEDVVIRKRKLLNTLSKTYPIISEREIGGVYRSRVHSKPTPESKIDPDYGWAHIVIIGNVHYRIIGMYSKNDMRKLSRMVSIARFGIVSRCRFNTSRVLSHTEIVEGVSIETLNPFYQ